VTVQPHLPDRIGRYRIVAELGRGSMGRVFRAYDPHTDREVALKVLVETSELDREEAEEARSRFLLEARAAGRLAHPAVVLVYDADVDAETDHPFLAMELVQGRSLAQLLRERDALPWREAVAIAGRVAEALDHAHERGIVHRDVKPGNVLVADDGGVKVSDFGIAKLVGESHTLAGSVMGTPQYMSPEQFQGEPLDGRSDLFGLGAMLYEMVTGEPPFRGDTLATISHKVVFVDPRPPSFARPDLPAEVERIVLRALAKDPNSRFATGREMAAALAAVGAAPEPATQSAPLRRPDSRTLVDPTAAPPRGSAPRRPRLVMAWLAVAALAVLAGGYWLGSRSEPPAAPAPGEGASPSAGPGLRSPATPAERPSDSGAQLSVWDRITGRREPGTLQLIFNNRLRGARMTVRVDGEEAWSTALNVSKDPISRLKGETVRSAISVAPGEREIEVHIVEASAGIDSRGTIRGDFDPGQKRWLRVVLIPYVPKLRLEWES
jgi:hypothetical protein